MVASVPVGAAMIKGSMVEFFPSMVLFVPVGEPNDAGQTILADILDGRTNLRPGETKSLLGTHVTTDSISFLEETNSVVETLNPVLTIGGVSVRTSN